MRNKETRAKYLKENAVKIAEQKHADYLANKDKYTAISRQWQANNRDRLNALQAKKMAEDPLFKAKFNMKSMIGMAFKYKGTSGKITKAETILGCSYQQFRNYIESKFEPWMTWKNKGLYKIGELNYGWDVDHIIPQSKATTVEELLKLNHYTNLQPLCSYTNRRTRHK